MSVTACGFVLAILLAFVNIVIFPDRKPGAIERWHREYRHRHGARWEFVFMVLPLVLAFALGYFFIWPSGDFLLDVVPWPWPRAIPILFGSAILVEVTREFRKYWLSSLETKCDKAMPEGQLDEVRQ